MRLVDTGKTCSVLCVWKAMCQCPLLFSNKPCSDVNKSDQSFELSRLVIEVWDWDRYTANDLIGGFSIPVPEIVEWSKGGASIRNWYRLLDGKSLKQKYEHVIDDVEAEKVSWEMV